jgi:RNA polymerase primary sigma factor
VWWIRQTILQAISDKGREIRVPQNQQTTSGKVQRKRNELLQEFEREPALWEIAAETGMTETDVARSMESYLVCSSLSSPVGDEEDFTLENVLEDQHIPRPDERMANQESIRIETQELLKSLSPREAEVLSLFFGINEQRSHTLNDIAEYFGISRERVRQIKDDALFKLRCRRGKEIFN